MEEYKKMQQPFLDENNEPIQMGVNDNLERLKALFPSVVKDGFVDFTALKEELGEIEEVGSEKYNLTWWGKQGAKIEARTPPIGKTLNYKENGNDNFKGETENLYIECSEKYGDNLDVLKLLQQNYFGKIKMIYIDPPYNTGKDFIYKDNFHMSKKESDIADGLTNENGERLEKQFSENAKGNRYHSNWLNMMYPRLKVAQTLLKHDGVIFISIDDNEMHNLRKICDEIFGEENFIGELVWESTTQPINSGGARFGLQKKTETIFLYAKNKTEISSFILEEFEESTLSYPHIGKFGKCRFEIIEKSDAGDYSRPTMKFEILGQQPREGKRWQIGEDTARQLEKQGKVEIVDGLVKKAVYPEDELDKKQYKPFWSFFSAKQNGTAQSGKDELTKIMTVPMGFDTVKPTTLLVNLMKYTTKENDIVLDFFSGSGTTAHAVMQLNAEDGCNRKFILVQIQEKTDETLEAFKNGYKNICEIGKSRICKAGLKIVEELQKKNKSYINENTQSPLNSILLNDNVELDEEAIDIDKYIKNPELLDIGFKVFEVGKTNIKWNEVESLEEIIELEEVYLKGKDKFDFMPHFTDENVVYEIALQHRGVPLSSSLEQLSDIGERTYLYANSYLVCLEEDITEEIIKKISKISPQPIAYYFRDSAFGENIALKDDTLRTFKDLVSINYGNNKGSYTLEFI